MAYDPTKHHRRSIRLRGYDYTAPGAYFVTICVKNRECLFGEVVDGKMRLNRFGQEAEDCWKQIPRHFPHVEPDAFIIMPNHVHGIVRIVRRIDEIVGENIYGDNMGGPEFVGAWHAMPPQIQATSPEPLQFQNQWYATDPKELFANPIPGALSTIIRSFKSAATKRINELWGTPGTRVWQREYYERVIREPAEIDRIRRYIADNPEKWARDEESGKQPHHS